MNVVCICRNENGNTTHLGVETENGIRLLTVEQMRQEIENGASFFVRTKGTDQAVKVLYDPDTGDFQYLNIFPDTKPIKQVRELEACEGCG
jgi:hypothetical protein